MPSVRVRLFASHREAARKEEVVLDLPEGATVARLQEELERQVPALGRFKGSTIVALNGEFAPETRRIRPGDEVAVFPPVAGG